MKKEVKGIGIWQMGREFSLELCLCPSSPASEPTFQFSAIPMWETPFFFSFFFLFFLITFMESGFWVFVYGCRMAMPLNHQKQIMVFNNGTASVCDLTELQVHSYFFFTPTFVFIWFQDELNWIQCLQVRAILGIASQERNSSKSQWWSNPERLSLQMPNGNAGFSIKKSLQRFLQRRNTRRIRSMSPYHKPRT